MPLADELTCKILFEVFLQRNFAALVWCQISPLTFGIISYFHFGRNNYWHWLAVCFHFQSIVNPWVYDKSLCEMLADFDSSEDFCVVVGTSCRTTLGMPDRAWACCLLVHLFIKSYMYSMRTLMLKWMKDLIFQPLGLASSQ